MFVKERVQLIKLELHTELKPSARPGSIACPSEGLVLDQDTGFSEVRVFFAGVRLLELGWGQAWLAPAHRARSCLKL